MKMTDYHDPKDTKGRTVTEIYQDIAQWFDNARNKSLIEQPLLDIIFEHINQEAEILDLGCGSGEPVADFFIKKGVNLTGVDATTALLDLCKERFPDHTWIQADMRDLVLEKVFDAVIVWDCLFHIPCAEQRKLFPKFGSWVKPGGFLLFNAGWEEAEFWNDMRGHESAQMFNASLSSKEYKDLLKKHCFSVVKEAVSDPDIGGRTYFLARKNVS